MSPTHVTTKRVVFLVQEEPLFVPILSHVLVEGLSQRLIAVGLFGRARSWKEFKREYLGRFRFYGAADFFRIASRYVWAGLTRPSVRQLFLGQGIKLIAWPSSSLRDPMLLETLKKLEPDIILVLGNQIVPKEILSVAKDVCFNIHLALLPRHRGREPVFNAFLAGDEYAGVTVHQMTQQLDAGDIYAQATLRIERGMTVLGTSKQLWEIGATLFCQMVLDWETRGPNPVPQEESKANYNQSFPDREAVKRFRRQGFKFL